MSKEARLQTIAESINRNNKNARRLQLLSGAALAVLVDDPRNSETVKDFYGAQTVRSQHPWLIEHPMAISEFKGLTGAFSVMYARYDVEQGADVSEADIAQAKKVIGTARPASLGHRSDEMIDAAFELAGNHGSPTAESSFGILAQRLEAHQQPIDAITVATMEYISYQAMRQYVANVDRWTSSDPC